MPALDTGGDERWSIGGKYAADSGTLSILTIVSAYVKIINICNEVNYTSILISQEAEKEKSK